MSAELLRLAERVEGLTDSSFEANKAILAALGYTWRGMDYWHSDGKRIWKASARFTASLDAALALIPPRAGWNLQGNTDVFYAVVSGHNGKGCTPALALTAAALRALASRDDERGE